MIGRVRELVCLQWNAYANTISLRSVVLVCHHLGSLRNMSPPWQHLPPWPWWGKGVCCVTSPNNGCERDYWMYWFAYFLTYYCRRCLYLAYKLEFVAVVPLSLSGVCKKCFTGQKWPTINCSHVRSWIKGAYNWRQWTVDMSWIQELWG